LSVLLTATLIGAVTFDRTAWPGFVGDEATYLMQAQSVAWDLDLTYTRADYDRFVATWGQAPEGLVLQSGNGGETITYGKPAFYSFALAPFVRLAPKRGHAVANATLLALAALLAAAALAHSIGPWAPLWVSAFIFGSVSFSYVWWAHADLFLMCLSATALALTFLGAATGAGRRSWLARRWVWGLAGALLAIVAMTRPFYASLLLPVALVAYRRRDRSLLHLVGGFAVLATLAVAGSFALHGTWSSYTGERMGFYSYTGFPGVDLDRPWADELEQRGGSGSWTEPLPMPVYPRLTAWNLLYFVAGRHVGLLPYFLPGLLGLAAFRSDPPRWALLLAFAATAAAFFYVRPFNFYGGGGAIANRYILPVYPALWFLAGRARRGPWVPVVVVLAAAPFLYPLWTSPRAFPVEPEGGFRYVTETARRLLPYETSQNHLKPSGQEDVIHHGLWLKLLTDSLATEAEGQRIVLRSGARRGELLLGSSKPLDRVEIEVASGGDPFDFAGGRLEARDTVRQGVRYRLALERPTARHRMWWTRDDVWLYRIRIERMTREMPSLGFSVTPVESAPGRSTP